LPSPSPKQCRAPHPRAGHKTEADAKVNDSSAVHFGAWWNGASSRARTGCRGRSPDGAPEENSPIVRRKRAARRARLARAARRSYWMRHVAHRGADGGEGVEGAGRAAERRLTERREQTVGEAMTTASPREHESAPRGAPAHARSTSFPRAATSIGSSRASHGCPAGVEAGSDVARGWPVRAMGMRGVRRTCRRLENCVFLRSPGAVRRGATSSSPRKVRQVYAARAPCSSHAQGHIRVMTTDVGKVIA